MSNPNVLEELSNAEVVGVRQAAGLQVFDLRWPVRDGHDYVTLDEALLQNILEVTEVSSGGTVPALKVTNKSEHMVFLMAGEELVGGKQNRVLNASMLVPAKGDMPIPVTCVESGRWGYKSSRFASGASSSHHNLRAMMSRQVTGSYRASGAPQADQGAVWGEIARKMTSTGTHSSSSALHDFYENYAKNFEQVLGALPAREGCNGAVFAIHGKIAGADLFDKPVTLMKLWTKLIKSYAADALENPPEKTSAVDSARVSEWLHSACSARQQWFDSPGVGKDVRIEDKGLTGATLVVDARPVHVELFREEEPAAANPA
ncbi:MAG: ARPP-1 family domain-containing protein [Terriglobia bacterium]